MESTIVNEHQYDQALERIYDLMQLDLLPDSDLSNEFEELADMVKEYDREHHPF